MKTYRKIIYLILCFTCLFSYTCVKYLDKTIKADITVDKIFTSFPPFQGFVEKMYYDVIDFTTAGNTDIGFNWDDHTISQPKTSGDLYDGDYMKIADRRGMLGPFICTNGQLALGVERGSVPKCCDGARRSIWDNGWMGIRDANTALAHLGDLNNATDEEKQLLEGQAYFFRGYFHWEIMKQWGGIPYIDTVFSATDKMEVPQLNFYAAAEKVLADLQKAADLLPVDWDNTSVGQVTLGINRERLTKGMALSFIAQVHLWCASPLMNGVSTGSYTYNIDYCKKAAASAWKVIEMANQGVYTLTPWANYSDMFKTNNETEPGIVNEVMFKVPYSNLIARWATMPYQFAIIGGENGFMSPSQNLVELFEMAATGLPINDPASGFDPNNPWVGRDPRFDYNILKDQDRIVLNRNDVIAFAQLYTGGRDRGPGQSMGGFGFKKFVFTDWNTEDNGYGPGRYCLPKLRLAEIYLYYAEAVNEAYGPAGKDPSANLTAIDAVNIIRTRAKMPGVNAKFTGTTEAFRERIRNERAVELCFEAKRRDDLRRWYIAHETKYKDLYSCEFPKDHSQFQNVFAKPIVFDLKHYWFPFPTSQVQLYKGWKQNQGW